MWEREREREIKKEKVNSVLSSLAFNCFLLLQTKQFEGSSHLAFDLLWLLMQMEFVVLYFFLLYSSPYINFIALFKVYKPINNKLIIWCKVFGRLLTIVCHPHDFKKCFYRIGITKFTLALLFGDRQALLTGTYFDRVRTVTVGMLSCTNAFKYVCVKAEFGVVKIPLKYIIHSQFENRKYDE